MRIGRAVLSVTNLDEAITWYRQALGFSVLFDSVIFADFRSVHVGPAGVSEAGVWLMPAKTARADSEPSVVLYSDTIDDDVARFEELGVKIASGPDGEPGNRSVQVMDPWGNLLIIAETPSNDVD